MKKSGKKAALMVACVLGAGLMLAGAGCGKKGPGEITARGETTIIENPTKTVEEYSAAENAYILAGKLKSLSSYRSEVRGEVVASLFGYKQVIADTHIKNGAESYTQAKSTSLLVNVGKQAFFRGDKVVMRDATDVKKDAWSEKFAVTTLAEYRAKRGAEPTALSNYILNQQTIQKAEFISSGSDVYTCRYEIDPALGTSRYAVKMMNYGGLNGIPQFESCVLEVSFDKDWNPISLKSEDKYKVNLVADMSCMSTMTETFYDIGKSMEIPEAELFRDKLGDDPTDIDPDDEEDKDGLSALADAILNTDLSGGVKVRGSLTADVGGTALSLPIDAWLSFDLARFASKGLSEAFRARITVQVLGIPVEIFYTGDNWMYIGIGSTRYKYEIPASETGMELDEVLGVFTAQKLSSQGNTHLYQLTLNDRVLKPANDAIKKFAETLSGNAKEFMEGFTLREVGAVISVHKAEKETGKISAVSLFADFDAAALSAEVSLSEAAESLPAAEVLAAYKEGDAGKLGSIFTLAAKLAGFDWKAGMNFTLDVGLAMPGFPLIISFPATFQILPEELLSGNILGAIRFSLAIDLASMEIYYENGMLYVVETTAVDAVSYAKNVTSVDVGGTILDLVAGSLGSGGGIGDVDLLGIIADTMMNVTVEETNISEKKDEEGNPIMQKRLQIHMPENVTQLVALGYSAIWDAIEDIDMGEMNSIKGVFTLFKFEVNDVYIRADFTDGILDQLALRLAKNKTAATGEITEEKSFVVGMTMGGAMTKKEADGLFDRLHAYLSAYEEGEEVRSLVEKLKAEGIQWLGDSYGAKLTEAENMYAALSDAAKAGVDYASLQGLRSMWKSLRQPVDEFVVYLGRVKTPGGEAYFQMLNPLFAAFDERQTEYLGKYAVAEYLTLRRAHEKNTVVPKLIADIDKLTAETYPTSNALNKAIEKAEADYADLYADSKALVTNYEKIEAARQAAKNMAVAEANAAIADALPKLTAITENSSFEDFRTAKQGADKAAAAYDALAAQEKSEVEKYAEFAAAKEAFLDLLGGKFRAAVTELGAAADITAGDTTYAKIQTADNWSTLFTSKELLSFRSEKSTLDACKAKHRDLEVNRVEKLIADIGTVEFTDACREKILAAREAFKGLREDYIVWCANRNLLADAEVAYVKKAIDVIDAEKLTATDKAKVELARRLYDEATSSYGGMLLDTVITNLLNKGNYAEKLEALEEAIAKL